VSDFDALADKGWGYLIDGAFEADGGIVVDDAFVAQEEDLIEFSFGQSGDGDPLSSLYITWATEAL
jgi:hypothetical protein